MDIRRNAALAALIIGGLGTNLGSNFVGSGDDPATVSGVCAAGSLSIRGQVGAGLLQGIAGAPLPAAVEIRTSCQDAASGTTITPGAGNSVTWRASTGAVNGAATATTLTDAEGRAEVLWTLGPAVGSQTLRVEVGTQATTIAAQANAPAASTGCDSGGTCWPRTCAS